MQVVSLLKEPANVLDHEGLATATAAKDQQMIGYASLGVTQQGVNQRLGLLAHQGLLGYVVEIKNAKIFDSLASLGQMFFSLTEIVLDLHSRDNRTARTNP